MPQFKFKIDGEGRFLFFPWGFLGKGYILPDQPRREKIKNFLRIYHLVSMPCMCLLAILVLTGCM
jgi:hypothetical protein